MKKILGICLGVLLIFSIVGSANASLITNGDFETGDLTDWSNPDGNVDAVLWTHPTNPAVTNWYARFNVPGGTGNAVLKQQLYVDPTWAGIKVEFDVLFSTLQSDPGDDYFNESVRLTTTSGNVWAAQWRTRIFEDTPGWLHAEAFIPFGGFTIDNVDPNALLHFRLTEVDDSWAALDNINVTAVPEPATMLLFGLGILGLAGVGRKKLTK